MVTRPWLLLCLLAGCAASPERPPAGVATAAPVTTTTPRETTRVWRLLRDATVFASDAVGEGGDLPRQVIAYRQLLRAPDAVQAFARLIEEATPAGRLYALCGLREVDPAGVARVASALLADRTDVEVQVGCVGGMEPVGDQARRILDDGDADMVAQRAAIRGTGRGWLQGSPDGDWARRGPETLEALDHLAALDAVVGTGPPPPWATTAEARATDEESLDRREGRELTHVSDSVSDEPLDGLREQLADRLVDCGPVAVPELVRATRHVAPIARMVALIALGRLGEWAEGGASAAAAAVDDPDVRVRWCAIDALRRVRTPIARAGLLRALGRPDEESELLRDTLSALVALASRTPATDVVGPATPLLGHACRKVRECAAELLADAGPAAAPALEPLSAALREWPEDEDADLVLWAIFAVGPPLAGPTFARALLETEGRRQEEVAHFLLRLDPPNARPAVAEVLARAAPGSRAARLATVVGLAKGGPDGAQELGSIYASSIEEASLRDLAGDGLARLGRAGLPALGAATDADGLLMATRLVHDLLASSEPADLQAALGWLDAPYRGTEAERVLVDAIEGWVNGREPVVARPVEAWNAALTVLLRWSTNGARAAIELLADRAPDAAVRARAAAALGR